MKKIKSIIIEKPLMVLSVFDLKTLYLMHIIAIGATNVVNKYNKLKRSHKNCSLL